MVKYQWRRRVVGRMRLSASKMMMRIRERDKVKVIVKRRRTEVWRGVVSGDRIVV